MIGNTISHFKILKKLGEGGMGVVYKAEDTKLKREVAIKFLPRQISVSLEERQRFEIEAQAAAALNHPNVAHIYSIEETDNEFFIVMEFIDGKELKDKIRDETIQMDEAVYLASCIAEGIHAAHKKDVVHRDIKSGNIMITEEGKVKIMDFGLAQMAGVTTLTKTGSTLGTTAYMSPEQASGEKLDAQTDIWSFGVVLYELLTGQLPFKGDYEQAIIYSIINDEPDPVTSFREDVPEMMQMIIQKLLKKDKKERYQSIQDFMFDLQKVSAYLSRRSSKSAISGVKPLAGYKKDFDGTSKSKFQQTEAQRRNITSFYCSISIKSEGDAETDPEELSEVLPQCIDICEKVITRYSGYISAYTSDSISV
jgi:serine/threonine protein kinase